MLKIEVASGISFHVFWNTVEGLNRTIRQTFFMDLSVLINDFNTDKRIDNLLKVLVQECGKTPEHFELRLSVECNELKQGCFNLDDIIEVGTLNLM